MQKNLRKTFCLRFREVLLLRKKRHSPLLHLLFLRLFLGERKKILRNVVILIDTTTYTYIKNERIGRKRREEKSQIGYNHLPHSPAKYLKTVDNCHINLNDQISHLSHFYLMDFCSRWRIFIRREWSGDQYVIEKELSNVFTFVYWPL